MPAVVLLATEISLLPDRIDLFSIVNASALGGLAGSIVGALCRFDLERIAKLTLLGTISVGTISAVAFFVLLVLHWEP